MKRFLLTVLLVAATACFTTAQQFYSHQQEAEFLENISSSYAENTNLEVIGKSAGGKDIHVLTIGKGDSGNKPALLIVAGIEADDLTGTSSANYFIEKLLSDDSLVDKLETFTVYVIPKLSPDPTEGYFASPKMYYHGNLTKDDQDRDGVYDEDGYEDVNNDGKITLMRIKDHNGTYTEHKDLKGYMKTADVNSGEIGKYIVMYEGFDNDSDGKINEDPVGGTDVNRNFTNDYKPYTDEGGSHPFSADELRALGNFVFDHPNIVTIYSFTYHNNIYEPWKIKYPSKSGSENYFQADSIAYSSFIKSLDKNFTYKGGKKNPGDISGWAFYDAGRFSFTSPAFAYPEVKDTSKSKDKKNDKLTREELAYKWLLENNPGMIIEWTKINDKRFGDKEIELGGTEPFVLNNPPVDSLDSANKNNFELLTKIFDSLPLLKVDKPKIEKLSGNVSRVTFTLRNEGILPTHTVVGRRVKALRPILIKTKLENSMEIKTGHKIEFIEDPLPGGAEVTKSFVITGNGKAEFEIGSPSAGILNISINL
ncbi:MAG: M14 family metallopeptidase [Melioribacteraceae bacterium]|nr:M14 family metallopeptidase [Melioribacteraceae bacterium]